MLYRARKSSFLSEAKDISRGGQNDEILFFPLETKKTTFC